MTLNLKFRACFVTFILIISSFSFIFIVSDTTVADDPLEDLFSFDEISSLLGLLGVYFNDVMSPHPYRFIGAYEVNETLTIEGEVVFDLYFSSTLFSQIGGKFGDKVNVSLHQYDYSTGKAKQIENASKTITLKPEVFGERVQPVSIELTNINHVLYEGEYLIISIELIQSEKPTSQFMEKIYEKKIKNRIEKIANFLNKTEDPDISQIGGMIKEFMSILEEAGIGSEEIAELANSFTSSAFYYGSETYSSNVYIPLPDSENKTLYFYNIPSEVDELVLGLGNIKTASETKPSGDKNYAWPPLPPISIDPESETIIVIEEDMEWFAWFFIWAISVMHESTVEDEDIVTYYLTKNQGFVLNEPEGNKPARIKLSTTPIKWEDISLERNKVIANATAELYLHYPRLIALRKVIINATLYDETAGVSIASDERQIDRTTLFELLRRGPDSPTIFKFEDAIGVQIWNGHNISLRLSVSQSPLFSLRSPRIVCDSTDYPSSVILRLKETDNINIEGAEDKKIIPAGIAEYTLKISSEYEDTVKIDASVNNTNDPDHWSIEYPESVDIEEKNYALVKVYVKSTENSTDAYNDFINLIFTATGKTGFDKKDSTVTVSTDAVDVDFEVKNPGRKEIKHGEKGTYKIVIRNLNDGFLVDTYEVTVTSEHGWNLTYPKMIYDLEPYVLNGEEYVLEVTLHVPKMIDTTSDKLTIKISSKEAWLQDSAEVRTITVTTKVINPNILEQIYNFFESVAEDLGLDDVLGEYGAAFLLFIVIFFILIFLVIIIYLITRKFAEIICLERIKDITSDEMATFDITIKNPTKNTMSYEIRVEMESESKSWDISLDQENMVVNPKQSHPVILRVAPTDYVKSDDWIEVKVIAKPSNGKKPAEISTLTTIKDGKPEVKIRGVLHWPRVFKKDDRVETSFKLTNIGNVSANNISVILYVNGKEKNKVEDITIPRGGYAEVEIPWIAVKGKNKVEIVVK